MKILYNKYIDVTIVLYCSGVIESLQYLTVVI